MRENTTKVKIEEYLTYLEYRKVQEQERLNQEFKEYHEALEEWKHSSCFHRWLYHKPSFNEDRTLLYKIQNAIAVNKYRQLEYGDELVEIDTDSPFFSYWLSDL
jgi:beta-lactamase class D